MPDFSQQYIPLKEVIDWLIVVTGQSKKQIYDSIMKAIKKKYIAPVRFISGKESIHVESFKIWAVTRPRAWTGVFDGFDQFQTVVQVKGVSSKAELGCVKQYVFNQNDLERLRNPSEEDIRQTIMKDQDRDKKIDELEKKIAAQDDKSKKMSEFGKRAKGVPKKT